MAQSAGLNVSYAPAVTQPLTHSQNPSTLTTCNPTIPPPLDSCPPKSTTLTTSYALSPPLPPPPQVDLCDVSGLAGVKRLQRGADHESRLHHYKEDEALRKRNAAAVAAGEGLQSLGCCPAVNPHNSPSSSPRPPPLVSSGSR